MPIQTNGIDLRKRLSEFLNMMQKTPPVTEKRVFLFILFLGLINGLVYIFLIPPWQHYDEPSQLEFAWLIANTQKLPKSGEYNQEMRREVAASMIERHFFDRLSFKPNLVSQTDPVWIGISQTGDRPIYYILVALPLYLLRTTDITFQLYVGRLVSLVLYLIVILCGYKITNELTRPGNPLRWMIPVLLVFIPSFTDSMTSINNDVGATAFFSLFLWSSILIIQRGFDLRRLFGLIITTALCFWTKNTVAFTVLLFPIVLLFSILTGKKRIIPWIVSAVIFLGLGFVIFSWGNAANWFSSLYVEQETRQLTSQAPLGKYALALSFQASQSASRLIQIIQPQALAEITGKQVTLGAWMWATKPTEAFSPAILLDGTTVHEEINLTETPQFVTITAVVPGTTRRVEIILAPVVSSSIKQDFTVYYDGLVLAEGNYPDTQAPQFSNLSARNGTWAGRPFTNLIQNGSGESGWPRVRVWADRLIARYTPIQPSTVLAAILDWRVAASYYQATMTHLLQTFWARFGWGNVVVTGFHPYPLLGIVTALGLLGAMFAGIRLRYHQSKPSLEIGFIFVFAIIWIWGAALFRGINTILGSDTFIPSSRYAFPAIIPTLLVLSIGWLESIQLIHQKLKINFWLLLGGFVICLLALNILSLVSIARFYY